MLVDLPFKVSSEEFERAIKKAAKPFWFILRDTERRVAGFDKNGKVIRRIYFTDNYYLYFKFFPLIGSVIHLSKYKIGNSDSLSVIGPTNSIAERIAERVYKILKEARR